LARLELRARSAVEGFAGGKHVSPHRGSGTTFAEHRQYVPGDEIRHLDWKLAARTDRFFVRRYEEETALTGYLVLDLSSSMAFSTLEWSKADYGRWLLASLARLLLIQNDRWGLALCQGNSVTEWVPPQGGERHWQDSLSRIESISVSGEGDPATALSSAAARMERRGLVVWVSDCLGSTEKATHAAALLRKAGHDLVVLRVLDPAEVSFPYSRSTRFESLEGSDELLLNPLAVREAYLEEFADHAAKLRRGVRSLGADFRRLQTDEPLEAGFIEFLARRASRMRSLGR
jgi:uncharacterized protein (DUF58 family)